MVLRDYFKKLGFQNVIAKSFFHFRNRDAEGKSKPRGGLTVLWAESDVTNETCFVIALCSEKDNYSRKWGRKIVLDRLFGICMGTWNKLEKYEMVDSIFETKSEALEWFKNKSKFSVYFNTSEMLS